MKSLNPWDAKDPKKRYVESIATNVRKTFKAARKRQLREAELRRRHELQQLKKAAK